MTATANLIRRSFEAPDETRAAGSGKGEVVKFSEMSFMRTTLPQGWKWSNEVKATAGTESCQALHLGYVVSGRLHVVMDDGAEDEFGPGDVMKIAPGHDAWVVGNEPYVGLDFTGSEVWAKAK